jgi:hypothetical protein
MSTSQTRLDIRVDVFEKEDQWAKPLSSLKPPDLITAIFEEFRELEYLSGDPEDYLLVKKEDSSPLDPEEALDGQLSKNAHLVLLEQERTLPKGTKPLSAPVYLREQTSGKVYKLHWMPAVIGRPDPNQANNDWLAVNLEAYPTGLRVSRRHAQITEDNGRYSIKSLSKNPTVIKDEEGNEKLIGDTPIQLENNDVVLLERSNISLKFIIRE